jgi:hypothetical protein
LSGDELLNDDGLTEAGLEAVRAELTRLEEDATLAGVLRRILATGLEGYVYVGERAATFDLAIDLEEDEAELMARIVAETPRPPALYWSPAGKRVVRLERLVPAEVGTALVVHGYRVGRVVASTDDGNVDLEVDTVGTTILERSGIPYRMLTVDDVVTPTEEV